MGDKNRKNVIIVGAGASKEFGLPVGSTLKTQIADLLDIKYDFSSRLISGNQVIAHALDLGNGKAKSQGYLFAGWKIRDAMPLAPSIDNFMHTHADNTELLYVGKLAITHAILEAEKNSILYAPASTIEKPQLDFDNISETWLGRFFSILAAERTFDQFINSLKSITLISFNYDRCIHQFFYYASLQYFDYTPDIGDQVMDALNIIYPYGTVGDFTCETQGGHSHIRFGETLSALDLVKQSQYLKTFTESVADEIHSEIHAALIEADLVMFLGFGFLGLNMELIHNGGKFEVDDVLGTVFEQSDNNIQSIRNEIIHHFKYRRGAIPGDPYVKLIDGTCAEFMNEFNRLLMG